MKQNTVESISLEDFAEFVFNMRQSLGLSCYFFGKKVGIAAETIRKWEKQASRPKNLESYIKKIREFVKAEHQKRRAEAT